MQRAIIIVLRNNCRLLELAMFAEALAYACEVDGGPGYAVSTCSPGLAASSPSHGWVRLSGTHGLSEVPAEADTIVVPDGAPIGLLDQDFRIVEFLAKRASRVNRIATLGNGVLFATAAGLTRGQTVVADPVIRSTLSSLCSETTVEPQAEFARSGVVWTARGKSAGFAMAIAMIEEDLGKTVAQEVLRRFDVGYDQLEARANPRVTRLTGLDGGNPIGRIREWVLANPSADLSIARLANMVAMSEKTLSRNFKQRTGQTIGEFVLAVRIGFASEMLASGDRKIKDIARLSGLGSQTNMRQLFMNRYGCSPSSFRNAQREAAHP